MLLFYARVAAAQGTGNRAREAETPPRPARALGGLPLLASSSTARGKQRAKPAHAAEVPAGPLGAVALGRLERRTRSAQTWPRAPPARAATPSAPPPPQHPCSVGQRTKEPPQPPPSRRLTFRPHPAFNTEKLGQTRKGLALRSATQEQAKLYCPASVRRGAPAASRFAGSVAFQYQLRAGGGRECHNRRLAGHSRNRMLDPTWDELFPHPSARLKAAKPDIIATSCGKGFRRLMRRWDGPGTGSTASLYQAAPAGECTRQAHFQVQQRSGGEKRGRQSKAQAGQTGEVQAVSAFGEMLSPSNGLPSKFQALSARPSKAGPGAQRSRSSPARLPDIPGELRPSAQQRR